MKQNLFRRWLITLAAYLLFLGVFHYFIGRHVFLLGIKDGEFHLFDISYYFILINSYWLDGAKNIYSPGVQIETLATFLSYEVKHAMPVGISPVGFLVLLPFSLIGKFDIHLAYSVFATFSITILILALRHVVRDIRTLNRELTKHDAVLLGIILLSFPVLSAIALGQTVVIAVAVLLFLFLRLRSLGQKQNLSDIAVVVFLVFFLALKPQYFLLGFFLVVLFSDWYTLLLVTAILVMLFLSYVFMLPTGMIDGYIAALQMFSSNSVPDYYKWAFVPKTMNVFRYGAEAIFGERLSLLLSQIGLALCLGSTLLVGLWKKVALIAQPHFLCHFSEVQLFVLFLGAYLLFSPHLGGYEDTLVLLIPVLIFLNPGKQGIRASNSLTITLSMVTLNHYVLRGYQFPLVFWLLKLLLILNFLYIGRRPSGNAPNLAE